MMSGFTDPLLLPNAVVVTSDFYHHCVNSGANGFERIGRQIFNGPPQCDDSLTERNCHLVLTEFDARWHDGGKATADHQHIKCMANMFHI